MTTIVYEHPLNERMRLFLRLEYLFQQADYFASNTSTWDCKNYCFNLIEIMNLLERNDVRKEVTKELEKQIKYLKSLQESTTIDLAALTATISQLSSQLEAINSKTWKLTKKLREDELLRLVHKRSFLINTACGFDAPSLYFWLNKPQEIRQNRIETWQNELSVTRESINVLLTIIRQSALFEDKTALAGVYQQILETNQPCQMIRITLPQDPQSYPEISANKHRGEYQIL